MTLVDQENVDKAIKEMNEKLIEGRNIIVKAARQRENYNIDGSPAADSDAIAQDQT